VSAGLRQEKYIRRRPERTDQRNVVFENAERRPVTRDGAVVAQVDDARYDDAFVGATELDL
jgi:hypothetical protein